MFNVDEVVVYIGCSMLGGSIAFILNDIAEGFASRIKKLRDKSAHDANADQG